MAQLSDDCFAFGGALLTVDQALALLRDAIGPVDGTETLPLLAASGRVLAAELVAPVSLPPFANSAVDGYAVRLADVGAGALPVRGRTAAGSAAPPLVPGTAHRIFTGAALPPGADTVFMQEDVRLEGGRVHLPHGLKPRANTRPAGEDVLQGAVALPAGRVLRPQELSLAAALGRVALPVRRRVRVALFSTGDELVEPGAAPGPAHRFDSNRILLSALLAQDGAEVTDLGILPDRRDAIEAALARCGHDLILTSGGVSAGEEDHVRAAVEAVGRLVFWRLAIKPGRPVAMGVIQGAAFMGLPGNPVAAYVTYTQLTRPLLALLSGAPPVPPPMTDARSAFAYRKKAGRREFVRVRLRDGAAHKHPVDGAGVLTSLTETDGLAVLGEDVLAVAPGDALRVMLYAS